jgi:hypothetical protein
MKRTIPGLLAAVLVATLSGLAYLQYFAEEQAFESVKPGGAYRLVVYRRVRPLSFAMPGAGSDAPGRVVLLDRSGRVLKEEPVRLVNMVSDVEWHDTEVSFQPFQGWSYPRATSP